jgi:hypothetical protein
MEVTLMMLPPPPARMRGIAEWVEWSSHVKFVRINASQPLGTESAKGW